MIKEKLLDELKEPVLPLDITKKDIETVELDGTVFQQHENLIKTTLIEAFTNHQDVGKLAKFIYEQLKGILEKKLLIFVKEIKRGNSNRIHIGNCGSLIELNVKKKFKAIIFSLN